MLTFLLSLDREFINEIIKDKIYYNDTFIGMGLKLGYNDYSTSILYHARSNNFSVSGNKVSYAVYRKDRLGKRMRGMWEPLTYRIKERYIDIIIDIAKIL